MIMDKPSGDYPEGFLKIYMIMYMLAFFTNPRERLQVISEI